LSQISYLTSAHDNLDPLHIHIPEDAVSLLQHQVRVNKQETVENLEDTWAGGYMKCTEQKPHTQSACRTVGGGKNFAIHPRFCAEQARVRGIDSFQFLAKGDETWCILKQCDSVDMQWQSSLENWKVFSQSCGLQRSRVKIQGSCREAFTGNLIFPKPSRSICRNCLKFKAISTNNLGGVGPNKLDEGHMRFLETLPGVDLVVKADENYKAHNPVRNGIHHGKFGRINMKSGSSTILNFQFVRSGTVEPVKVTQFVFTVFDIDQFKDCWGRMTVTAFEFSSYHVGANTELIVKTDAGDVGRPASTTFMSSMSGNKYDNPTAPRALTPTQLARSVSFVFRNKESFNMGFEITDASAQNILFGGKSTVLDPICGPPRR